MFSTSVRYSVLLLTIAIVHCHLIFRRYKLPTYAHSLIHNQSSPTTVFHPSQPFRASRIHSGDWPILYYIPDYPLSTFTQAPMKLTLREWVPKCAFPLFITVSLPRHFEAPTLCSPSRSLQLLATVETASSERGDSISLWYDAHSITCLNTAHNILI